MTFLHEKGEKTPRFIMEPSAEKRTIYNQINTRPKSSPIIDNDIPLCLWLDYISKETGGNYWYVYVIAEASTTKMMMVGFLPFTITIYTPTKGKYQCFRIQLNQVANGAEEFSNGIILVVYLIHSI